MPHYLDENPKMLAPYLRSLALDHPERVAYRAATKPGSRPGSAPRTIKQLQNLVKS